MSDGEQKCWACDRPLGDTLDLTDDEVDALYEHLMETEQEAPPYIARHLSRILDKLPEHEVLTRDPPAELRAELVSPADSDETPNSQDTERDRVDDT